MRREMYVLLFAPWSRLYAIRFKAQRYQQKRLLSIRFGSVRFHVACCPAERGGRELSCYQCSRSARAKRWVGFSRGQDPRVPPFGFSSPIICAASGCFPAHRHRHKEIIQNHRLFATSSFPERTKLHAAPQAREDQPSNKFPCTAPTCPNLQRETSCQTHCNIHCTRRAGIRIALLAGHQPCLFPSKQAR